MDKQNEDWITWEGGVNPVPGAVVDVKFRNGWVERKEPSSNWQWHHSTPGAVGWDYEIVGYIVVEIAAPDPQSEIARLQERVRELEEAAAWRPIETCPCDGKSVVLGSPEWGGEVTTREWTRREDFERDLANWGNGPTVWMRPTSPSITEEGEGE